MVGGVSYSGPHHPPHIPPLVPYPLPLSSPAGTAPEGRGDERGEGVRNEVNVRNRTVPFRLTAVHSRVILPLTVCPSVRYVSLSALRIAFASLSSTLLTRHTAERRRSGCDGDEKG